METKTNVQTIGFQGISGELDIMKFIVFVSRYWSLPTGKQKADMFVGSPDIKEVTYQDEGRTMLLPIKEDLPKVYACVNETGGLTFMLAEEY